MLNDYSDKSWCTTTTDQTLVFIVQTFGESFWILSRTNFAASKPNAECLAAFSSPHMYSVGNLIRYLVACMDGHRKDDIRTTTQM
jgi:hypothetical protein